MLTVSFSLQKFKDVIKVVGVALDSIIIVNKVLSSIINVNEIIEIDKINKKQYSSISKRLNTLQSLVGKLQKTEGYEQSDEVFKALKNLQAVLESAEREVQNYNIVNMLEQLANSRSYKEKVDNLNQRLTEADNTLTRALRVYKRAQEAQRVCIIL